MKCSDCKEFDDGFCHWHGAQLAKGLQELDEAHQCPGFKKR